MNFYYKITWHPDPHQQKSKMLSPSKKTSTRGIKRKEPGLLASSSEIRTRSHKKLLVVAASFIVLVTSGSVNIVDVT